MKNLNKLACVFTSLLWLPMMANADTTPSSPKIETAAYTPLTAVDPELKLLKNCAQTSYDAQNGGALVNAARRVQEAQTTYAAFTAEYNAKYRDSKPKSHEEYALYLHKYNEFNARTQELAAIVDSYNSIAKQGNSQVAWFNEQCKGRNFNQYLWGQLPLHLRKAMDQ